MTPRTPQRRRELQLPPRDRHPGAPEQPVELRPAPAAPAERPRVLYLRISPALYRRVRQAALDLDRPAASIGAEALEEWLDRHEGEAGGQP